MTVLRTLARPMLSAAFATGTLLFATAPSAGAQAPAGTAGALMPVGPSRIVSTNPFLPLFGYFSAEYEQRIKDNVALGISGSTVEYDERITHLDAKVRLYPNDRALEGFSIASSLGIAWIRRNPDECGFLSDCVAPPGVQRPPQRGRTLTTPTFAIEGAYQWLLGRSRSTAITAGLGAKRYLGGSRADFDGLPRVLPTGRLSIGYGF